MFNFYNLYFTSIVMSKFFVIFYYSHIMLIEIRLFICFYPIKEYLCVVLCVFLFLDLVYIICSIYINLCINFLRRISFDIREYRSNRLIRFEISFFTMVEICIIKSIIFFSFLKKRKILRSYYNYNFVLYL